MWTLCGLALGPSFSSDGMTSLVLPIRTESCLGCFRSPAAAPRASAWSLCGDMVAGAVLQDHMSPPVLHEQGAEEAAPPCVFAQHPTALSA